MNWENIRGAGEQVQRFRRSIERGRLAHAYLFVGPEGIGKKLFARSLAQCMHCRRTWRQLPSSAPGMRTMDV